MKKFLLYALTAILAVSATSCKDDEVMGPINPAEDLDRMPMTMFRLNENTGKGEEDPYGMQIITSELNTAHLVWYGIKGAAGYEIKYGIGGRLQSGREEDWNDPERITEIIRIDDPEQLSLDIPNLEYGTHYRFAIRVLNPDGIEAHHSKWYGYGDGRQWAEQAGLTTLERYNTPGVLNVGNISEDRSEFTAYLDINVERAIEGFCETGSEQEKQMIFEEFKKNFELFPQGSDDYHTARFKVTTLSITPAFETPAAGVNEEWKDKTISLDDFDEDGKAEFRVTGLTENAIYICNVINDNIPVDVDACYNTVRKPVYGEPGDPIIIEHTVRATDSIPGETAFQACQLDKIIGAFGNDINLAEGQVFYLRGGKAYYFYESPAVTKGFTLATLPEDLAEGKRATVYLGGIGNKLEKDGFTLTNELQTCNFSYGRLKNSGEADCPIEIGEVCFKDIDFDVPLAKNGGSNDTKGGGTGNYFANCVDGGMAVTIKSWKVQNCTFQNINRGFCRVKSSKAVVFDEFIVENCIFYNSGFYGITKGGYAFVSDGQSNVHNMYKNMQIRNNTFYDFTTSDIIGKDGANKISSYKGVSWNIRIENNTFINNGAGIQKSNKYQGTIIFNNQRYPDNMKFSFKNNLFVMAAADGDINRPLQCKGCDLRNMYDSGLGQDVEIDICNNFSISSNSAYDGDNKIFLNNAFNNSKNSFAALNYNGTTIRLVNTAEDLIVKPLKVDGNYPRPGQLFSNPYSQCSKFDDLNPTVDMHSAPADIWNALKYKSVPAELNGIGDPRWATADPKNCYNGIE